MNNIKANDAGQRNNKNTTHTHSLIVDTTKPYREKNKPNIIKTHTNEQHTHTHRLRYRSNKIHSIQYDENILRIVIKLDEKKEIEI